MALKRKQILRRMLVASSLRMTAKRALGQARAQPFDEGNPHAHKTSMGHPQRPNLKGWSVRKMKRRSNGIERP